MKIWVAGCGTRQAVEQALVHPTAKILATDISRESLKVAEQLSRNLGLTNIEFAQVDLMNVPFKDEFDFVYCTGVLHHLADPLKGFRSIRRALRRDGAAFIMVYNTQHRYWNQAFQKGLEIFLGKTDRVVSKARFANVLATAIKSSPKCVPLNDHLRGFDFKGEAEIFTDSLIHPQETSYSIDGLLEFISNAGFRMSGWAFPELWNLTTYLDDQNIIKRFNKLDSISRYKVIYFLAGQSSPLLEFYAERDDFKQRPMFSQKELLALKPQVMEKWIHYRIDNAYRLEKEESPAFKVSGSKLIFWAGGMQGFGRKKWSLPRDFISVLKNCNGQASIGELLDRFEDKYNRRDLFSLLVQLLSPDRSLLVPSYLS